MNKEVEQTKVLSITDTNGKSINLSFVESVEKEKASLKLYYYMWLSRLFIFFSVISLAVFMSCSLALFKLAPMVFVEPFLIVEQDSSKDLARAEAITYDMVSKDMLLETFMRQYVIIRNTIVPDAIEMETRWSAGGMVNYYSNQDVFFEFTKNSAQVIKKAVQDGINRSVIIDNIGRIGGQKSPIWKVDFRTLDLNPKNTNNELGAMKVVTRYWTASINANFFPSRIFMARRLINPLGFTVIDYSQTQVNVF